MGVDAGEAERIDAGSPRRSRIGMNPGSRWPVELERSIRGLSSSGCGCSAFKVGGKNAVEQCQCRLDQSGHAGGRHGMADHRRDGAQEPMAVLGRGKTALSALSSARSAAGTPRPWPSTRATVAGSMPERR